MDVGGGTLASALQGMVVQPSLWASAAAVAINLLNLNLPPSVRIEVILLVE